MEHRPQSQLVQEVTKQLVILEDAITRINTTRKQLKQRSGEVKSDIQSCVTRQLEALRERESYLLHQVDLIQQAKDAALQGQEGKLHEALGSLTTALQVNDQGGACHITDILNRLKSLSLYPAETSNLSFRANLAHVRDVISSFGHVATHGLSASGLFDQEPSSCLPRAFEDYDDEDHHILHKSVVDGSSGPNREITVNVPRLSQRLEDWIMMPSEDATPAKTTPDPTQFIFPPFGSSSMKNLLCKRDDLSQSMSSTTSIHQWLCDIQAQGEVEEQEVDFEVISPPPSFIPVSSKGSSIEVLSCMDEIMTTPVFTIGGVPVNPSFPSVVPTSPAPPPNSTQAYFTQVQCGPSNHWLLSGGTPASEEPSTLYGQEILRYFHEVSSDTKQWLIQYEKKQEASCPDTNKHAENLGQLRRQQSVTSDPECWLHKEDDLERDMEDIRNVCKDNKPCQSFNECQMDENCRKQRKGCLGKNKIVQQGVTPVGIEGYFNNVVQQGKQGWLLGCGEVLDENLESLLSASKVDFPPFSNQDCGSWLLSGQCKARVPPCNFDDLSNVESDPPVKWLSSSSSSSTDVASLAEKWKAIFSHKFSVTPSSSPVKNNRDLKLAKERESMLHIADWLMSSVSSTSDTSVTSSSQWLLTTPNVHGPTSEKIPKEVWLLSSESGKDKESNNAQNKNIELPECLDDEPDDVQMMDKSLFDCFKSDQNDGESWLCKVNVLVQ